MRSTARQSRTRTSRCSTGSVKPESRLFYLHPDSHRFTDQGTNFHTSEAMLITKAELNSKSGSGEPHLSWGESTLLKVPCRQTEVSTAALKFDEASLLHTYFSTKLNVSGGKANYDVLNAPHLFGHTSDVFWRIKWRGRARRTHPLQNLTETFEIFGVDLEPQWGSGHHPPSSGDDCSGRGSASVCRFCGRVVLSDSDSHGRRVSHLRNIGLVPVDSRELEGGSRMHDPGPTVCGWESMLLGWKARCAWAAPSNDRRLTKSLQCVSTWHVATSGL